MEVAHRIYTRTGSCLQLSMDGKHLGHAPIGICTPNLLATLSASRLTLLDMRSSQAHPAFCDLRSLRDDLHSLPGPAELENFHVAPTPEGTVIISAGQAILRASGDGRCVLSSAPIDGACEFILSPEQDILRLGDAVAIADDEQNVEVFHPTLEFPGVAHYAEQLLAQGKLGRALEIIFHTVNTNCLRPRFKGRSLFIRDFDRILKKTSDMLWKEPSSVSSHGFRLIIATEIYVAGGHTRIIEDIADLFPDSVILLTDCFRNVEQGRVELGYFSKRLPKTKIIRLGSTALLDKVRHLVRFVSETSPQAIYFAAHHQDPIPYAALSSERVSQRKFFVHHADHNPSLGASYPTFEHYDCTKHLGALCSCMIGKTTRYLPLSVADEGVSAFARSDTTPLSTVTAGNVVKFEKSGTCAYPDLVAAILTSTGGKHFHIGHLPSDWIDAIRNSLARSGVDLDRFAYLGVVPSLWQTLKSLDVQVYVASAPTPGTRAAIEAQGAGLPVLFFQNNSVEPLLRMREMYASRDLGWSSIADIPSCFSKLCAAYSVYAQAARQHYESNYARHVFENAIT